MKRVTLSALIALLTFVVGIGASADWLVTPARPASPPNKVNQTKKQPALEMVFVLDTTGSMSGLIEGAKAKIWGIVNDVMQNSSRPAVRIGLVAYRDIGDQYVTQVLPLTDDLDKVYVTLMDYRAEGGGDEPENVRRALADGVHKAGWSLQNSGQTAQVIFLVGDAPPHDDYQNEPDILTTTAEAVKSGMIVNTIQCGNSSLTRQSWEQIARRGEGRYFAIAQDGGVEVVSTPFDSRLTELGAKLGSTFMAYGGGAGTAGRMFRQETAAAQEVVEVRVTRSAPASASADRAVNKALNSKAYANDLLQGIENESVKLDTVKDEDLPDEVRKLSPEGRKAEINKRLEARRKLRAEIVSLSKQRDAHLAAERKKHTAGKQGGFDAAVSSALKEQMARKGIK